MFITLVYIHSKLGLKFTINNSVYNSGIYIANWDLNSILTILFITLVYIHSKLGLKFNINTIIYNSSIYT